MKGPLASGTVTAFALDARLERGQPLGVATTGPTGEFALQMGTYNGPVLLVVSTGAYVDEATGVTVQLGGNELTAIIPAFQAGSTIAGLRVTPVSTLATAFAFHHVRRSGAQLAQALDEAYLHLDAHFGNVDWRTTAYGDLTVPGVSNLSPEARMGLVLAGLSQLGRQISEANGLTAGTTVNAGTLTTALVQDVLHDGALDGVGPQGTLKQANTPLSGATLRRSLGQAVAAFVSSSRNQSALRAADVRSFQEALATNADPYLFCPGGVLTDMCAAGGDIDPPTVSFIKPTDGSGVNGTVAIEVRAEDASIIKALRFTSPTSLLAAAPVFENGGKRAVLRADLDVSALPDGPLTLSVQAVDAVDNQSDRAISVVVANTGPTITIGEPVMGTEVKGSIVVTASATSDHASIARLEVVNPPPGLGLDKVAAASDFAATWDTTRALEGPLALTFRATDGFGTSTDKTVDVVVNNVALGVVSATVTAGAPVKGARVKLQAIDEATGLPLTSRPGGSVLGTSTDVTNDAGQVTFTLTGENYQGPVQLVAFGSGMTFVDPSNGSTQVTADSAFTFTSYLPSYRTGDALSAPVTLLTTLADATALAFVKGLNQSTAAPAPGSLVRALTEADNLFAGHFTRPELWSLRTVQPVSLTQPPQQGLRDVVYAALNDVTLNQLARDIALESGQTPGLAFSAISLTQKLLQDMSGDGIFDGRASGIQLTSGAAGTAQPYKLDANTLRFRQSIALERFVRSSQNKTGLTRDDFMAKSVYDNIALDTSVIFPSDQATVPFDTQAPAVTVTTTFVAADGTELSPLGASSLVARTVKLHVSTSDPAGVAVLRVQVGTTNVPSSGQGSSTAQFDGTWDTTAGADGPLTFTIYAEDGLGNGGTTQQTVTVDNTAPGISIVSPVAGFYSTTLVVDANASDANGVQSFVVEGLAGFEDNDSGVGRVINTNYAVPAMADGPLTMTFRACDAVRNCRLVGRTVSIDRTPPVVAFAESPVGYTNASRITVRVSAADGMTGSGVARVLVAAGTQAPEPATWDEAHGSYVASLPLATDGRTPIRAWALDAVQPANGGESINAVGATIVMDTKQEPISPVVSSYVSERDLDIAYADPSQGIPEVPVQLVGWPAREAIGSGSNVYKLVTRLSSNGATAQQLEDQTADMSTSPNTPYLAFSIPQANEAGPNDIKAPTARAYGEVSLSCPGCPSSPVVVPALFASFDGTYSRYLVPLSSDVLPHLSQTMEPRIGMSVVFKVQDAAGNTSDYAPVSLTFHIIGPKVGVKRDDAYSDPNNANPDPQSIYAYRVGNLSYDNLFWAGNPSLPAGAPARVVRYLVRNPFNTPLVVTLNPEGSQDWSFRETWTPEDKTVPGTGAYSLDSFNFNRSYQWDPDGDTVVCGSSVRATPPCANPSHRAGVASTQWTCDYLAAPSIVASFGTTWDMRAYSPPSNGGNEQPAQEVAPEFKLNGRPAFRVPAASATRNGELVVYVVIARNRTADSTYNLSETTLPGITSETLPTRYQFFWGDRWVRTSTGTACWYQDDFGNSVAAKYELRETRRVVTYLAASQFQLVTPVSVLSSATSNGGASLAGPAQTNAAAGASVSFTH